MVVPDDGIELHSSSHKLNSTMPEELFFPWEYN